MAFPVVADVTENSTNSAGTNHTINHPTVVAGQLWLLILDKGSTSASVNAHSLWTELLDEAQANGLYIAYHWTDGTEGASSTLVTSASTRSASHLYRITGAENPATQAPQIGTTASGSSATPDPPASAAPGATKDFLFIAFYGAAGEELDDDTWSDTPPANYTPSPPHQKSCGTAGTNLGGLIASAWRQLNTGSADNPGTFAKDVSAAWRAQTILVHPASSQQFQKDLGTNTLSFSSGAVVRETRRALSATLSFASGSLARVSQRLLTAAVSFTGDAARQTQRALAAALSFASGTLAASRLFSKAIDGTLSFMSGTLARLTARAVDGDLTTSGVTTAAGRFVRSFTGTLSVAGDITRSAGKALEGALTLSAALNVTRLFSRLLTGSLALAGEIQRQTARALAGTLGVTGEAQKQSMKVLAGVLSLSASIGRTVLKAISGALSFASGHAARTSLDSTGKQKDTGRKRGPAILE